MKYDLHIYAVVRVRVDGIEAHSQQEVIRKAYTINLERIINRYNNTHADLRDFHTYPLPNNVAYVEFGDEIQGFLVDEAGDADYSNSTVYDRSGAPLKKHSCRTCGQFWPTKKAARKGRRWPPRRKKK